jgi:hypothetical protein
VDGNDGAAVRIALTCAGIDNDIPRLLAVSDEGRLDEQSGENWVVLAGGSVEVINADLTKGAATNLSSPLRSNTGISFMGVIPKGVDLH